MKIVLRLTAFTALFLLVACAGRLAQLDEPAPIIVPSGLSEEQVNDAIIKGLYRRGWMVSREEPGRIIADLHLRDHFARINIDYDTSEVVIRYADSRNLDYSVEGGQKMIHTNFNSWLFNLSGDIRNELIRQG